MADNAERLGISQKRLLEWMDTYGGREEWVRAGISSDHGHGRNYIQLLESLVARGFVERTEEFKNGSVRVAYKLSKNAPITSIRVRELTLKDME